MSFRYVKEISYVRCTARRTDAWSTTTHKTACHHRRPHEGITAIYVLAATIGLHYTIIRDDNISPTSMQVLYCYPYSTAALSTTSHPPNVQQQGDLTLAK